MPLCPTINVRVCLQHQPAPNTFILSAKWVRPQCQTRSSPIQNTFVVRCQRWMCSPSLRSICTLSAGLQGDDGHGSTSQIRHFSRFFLSLVLIVSWLSAVHYRIIVHIHIMHVQPGILQNNCSSMLSHWSTTFFFNNTCQVFYFLPKCWISQIQ